MIYLSRRTALAAAQSALRRRPAVCRFEVSQAVCRHRDGSRDLGWKVALFDRAGRFIGNLTEERPGA